MIIRELRPGHFGKFHNQIIRLEPGVNVIYGRNEAGKSTLHSFIKGMFFGMDRLRGKAGKDDPYMKYQPWDTPGEFCGSIDIEYKDTVYRIDRSFYQKKKSFTVTDIETGRTVPMSRLHAGDVIPGFNESTYRNTISMEQLHAKTDAELAKEVANFIANLSTAKSNEVDVAKALENLQEKRKNKMAESEENEIAALEEAIELCKQNEVLMEQYSISLRTMEKKHKEIKEKILNLEKAEQENKQTCIRHLPFILENYKRYGEIKKQIRDIREKTEEYEKKAAVVRGLPSSERIQNDITKYEQLTVEKYELEQAFHKDVDELGPKIERQDKNTRYLSLIPAAAGMLLLAIPFGAIILKGVIGVLLIVIGIYLYVTKVKDIEKARNHITALRKEYEKNVIHIQSRKKDILLENKVVNLENLRSKLNEILIAEHERSYARQLFEDSKNELEALRNKRDEIHHQVMNFMKFYMNDPDMTEECMLELKNIISERQEEHKEEKDSLLKQERDLALEIEKLKWNIEALEDNENQLIKKQQMLEQMQHREQERKEEISSINLAIRTIQNLAVHIHDSFGAELNERISAMVYEVTGGIYGDIIMDERMSIKVRHNHSYVPLDRLSAGTIEQVYLAIRLALADLFFNKEKMPIIIDDAFAYYDDERMSAALRCLTKECDRQILIFTCHHRETELLEKEQIPYHLIDLENSCS